MADGKEGTLTWRLCREYREGTGSGNLQKDQYTVLPSQAYWYTLEDILTKYVKHNDNKFNYDSQGTAHRKHIIADRIRYIGKESNNLEDNLTGLEDPDYLEYENPEDFKQWILSLKPKDVRDKGISERTLYKIKHRIKEENILNPKTKIVKILIQLFKETKLNDLN
jgi:hypothetical protein